MSKSIKIFMALALVLVLAAPAMAEVKLNGYYRLQGDLTADGVGFASNSAPLARLAEIAGPPADPDDFGGTLRKDSKSASFFDQRIRLKMTNTLNDYVSVVYYGEVDAPFGRPSKGGIGNGGQISADGVNVETKNFYVDFKVPDTSWKARTGIQGWGTGNPYESMVVDDDMAGINLTGNAGPVSLDLIYSKWNEGSTTNWDDRDFYGVTADVKANEQLGFGAMFLYLDDNRSNAKGIDDYYFGLNGDFRFADFGVAGFFLYRDFSDDDDNIEGNAWMVDLKGRAVIPMGDVQVHFAYIPDNDDTEDFNVFSPSQGGFEYHNDNLMIFLTDVYYNNGAQGARAFGDAAYSGFGLWFVTVSGKLKLPQDFYAKYGVGYFSAVEETPLGTGPDLVEGTTLGTEVAAMVGKKFAEKYDLSLRGGYGFLGDFYDSLASNGDDPDDLYKVVAMLNVSF